MCHIAQQNTSIIYGLIGASFMHGVSLRHLCRTSARMEQKLFLNNLFFIRAEVIPSVSPTDPPFEQQFHFCRSSARIRTCSIFAELPLDSSRSYSRLKHRFPVCHIVQQNTSITYARTAFTRRIAARLEHRFCLVCHLDICAELLLESSRRCS